MHICIGHVGRLNGRLDLGIVGGQRSAGIVKSLSIAGALLRFCAGDNDQGERKQETRGGPASPAQAFARGDLPAEKSCQQADTDEQLNREFTRLVHRLPEV